MRFQTGAVIGFVAKPGLDGVDFSAEFEALVVISASGHLVSQAAGDDSCGGDGGFDEVHGLVSNGFGSVTSSGRLDGDVAQLIPDHVVQGIV